MSRLPAVVLVVPARDESQSIVSTLRCLYASARRARRGGLVGPVAVEVVAHKCVDDTAARAGSYLRWRRNGRVVEDATSQTIGAVRDTGARRGLDRLGWEAHRSWVLSTDADTSVDVDWVSQIIVQAHLHDAAVVVGVADLDRWRGSVAGRAAYDALVAAKHRTGSRTHQHDHVYGANLAVRADAYLEVGGFPHVVHGEDQQLVDTLALRGHRVLRTRSVSVTTSGRTRGRAPDGLADLLRHLDDAVVAHTVHAPSELSGGPTILPKPSPTLEV